MDSKQKLVESHHEYLGRIATHFESIRTSYATVIIVMDSPTKLHSEKLWQATPSSLTSGDRTLCQIAKLWRIRYRTFST